MLYCSLFPISIYSISANRYLPKFTSMYSPISFEKAFAMASGRCVAYIAHKLGTKRVKTAALGFAKKYEDRISYLYLKNGKDNFDFPRGSAIHTPGNSDISVILISFQ